MLSVLLDGHPGVALRGPSSIFKRVDCLCFCAHWDFCPFAAALAAQPLGAVEGVDVHWLSPFIGCLPPSSLTLRGSSDPESAAQAAFSQRSGSSPCRPGVSLLPCPPRRPLLSALTNSTFTLRGPSCSHLSVSPCPLPTLVSSISLCLKPARPPATSTL